MKFLSIVILACLAFSNVHGASEFPTNFEELGEMYDQGTLPTEEETFGWWSGRCYAAKAPSKPIAGLLASRINIDPANGGDFPPKTAHQMMFFHAKKVPANYYDNDLSNFKDAIVQIMRSPDNQTFTTEEREGSLASTDGIPIFSLKKYSDFFVGRVSRYPEINSNIYGHCYYFKKVY